MPKPIGILLVGGSHTHQENYARGFAADSRCRLIGLTDETVVPPRRAALNAKLAAELDIPLFPEFEAALERDDVDIVSVCAEPERRARIAVRSAEAGKHVYIDKPMAASTIGAQEIVSAVKQADVRSQVFSLVRAPAAARAKQILESGRLGTLVSLHCELLFAKGIAGTADLSSVRREQPDPDAFTFLDAKRELFCVGWYPLILFQWLTGRRYRSVTGTTGNYFFKEHQGHDVEDFACMSLELDDGIDASLMVGRTGWRSHPHYGVHVVHLIGSEGSVTIDADRPRLEVYSTNDNWRLPPAPHPEDPMGFWSSTQRENAVPPKLGWQPILSPAASDMSCFVDCVAEDRESDVNAQMGAHAVEAIMRGYESAASGTRAFCGG